MKGPGNKASKETELAHANKRISALEREKSTLRSTIESYKTKGSNVKLQDINDRVELLEWQNTELHDLLNSLKIRK